MKIDKKTVDSLLALDDEKLVGVVRLIAARSGYAGEVKTPGRESLAGIRRVLGSMSEDELARAAELAEIYKKKKG